MHSTPKKKLPPLVFGGAGFMFNDVINRASNLKKVNAVSAASFRKKSNLRDFPLKWVLKFKVPRAPRGEKPYTESQRFRKIFWIKEKF